MNTMKSNNSSKNIVYLRKNPPQQELGSMRSQSQWNQQVRKFEQQNNRKVEQGGSQYIDQNNNLSNNQKNGINIKTRQKLSQSSIPFIHHEGDDYNKQKDEMQRLLEQEELELADNTQQKENQQKIEDYTNIYKNNQNNLKPNLGVIILSNNEIQQETVKHVYFIVISQQEEKIKDHFEFTISSEEDQLQDLQDHFKLISRKVDFFQNNSEESFILAYSSKQVKKFLKSFNLDFLDNEINKEAIYLDQLIPEKYKLVNNDICLKALIDDLEQSQDANLYDKIKILSYFNNLYSTSLIQLILKLISKKIFITKDLSIGSRERKKFQNNIMNKIKQIKNYQNNIFTNEQNQINIQDQENYFGGKQQNMILDEPLNLIKKTSIEKQEKIQHINNMDNSQSNIEKYSSENYDDKQINHKQTQQLNENNKFQSISQPYQNSIQNQKQQNNIQEISEIQSKYSKLPHQGEEEQKVNPIQQEEQVQINKDHVITKKDEQNSKKVGSITIESNQNTYCIKNNQSITNQQDNDLNLEQKQNESHLKKQFEYQESKKKDFLNYSSSYTKQNEQQQSRFGVQNVSIEDNTDYCSRQLNYGDTSNSNRIQSMNSVNKEKRYENDDFDLISEIKKQIHASNQLTEMNTSLKQTIETQILSQQEYIQQFTQQQSNIFESVKNKQKMMLDLFIQCNQEAEQILASQTQQVQIFQQDQQKNNELLKDKLSSEIMKSNDQIQNHSQKLQQLVIKVQSQEELKQFEIQQQQLAIQEASRLLIDCSQALLVRNPMTISQIRENMNQQTSLNQSNSLNNFQSVSNIFGGNTGNNQELQNKYKNIQNNSYNKANNQSNKSKSQKDSLQSSFQSQKPNLQNHLQNFKPQIESPINNSNINQINQDHTIDEHQNKFQTNFDNNLQNLNTNQQQIESNQRLINLNQQQIDTNQQQTQTIQNQFNIIQNKIDLSPQQLISKSQSSNQIQKGNKNNGIFEQNNIAQDPQNQNIEQEKNFNVKDQQFQKPIHQQQILQQLSFSEQYSNKSNDPPIQSNIKNEQNEQIATQSHIKDIQSNQINEEQFNQIDEDQRQQTKTVQNQQTNIQTTHTQQIQLPNNEMNRKTSNKNKHYINENEIVISLDFQETPTNGQEQIDLQDQQEINQNEESDRNHESSVSNLSSIVPNEFINEQQSEQVQNNFNDFQSSEQASTHTIPNLVQKLEEEIFESKKNNILNYNDIGNDNDQNNLIEQQQYDSLQVQINKDNVEEMQVNSQQIKENQIYSSNQIKNLNISPNQINKDSISNFDSANQLNQYQLESNEQSSNIKSNSQNSDELFKQKVYSSNFNSQTIKSSEIISSELTSQQASRKAILLRKLKNQQVQPFKLNINTQDQQANEIKEFQNQLETQNSFQPQRLQSDLLKQQQQQQQQQTSYIEFNQTQMIPNITISHQNHMKSTKNLFNETKQKPQDSPQDMMKDLNFFKTTSNNKNENETLQQHNDQNSFNNQNIIQENQQEIKAESQQFLQVNNNQASKNLQQFIEEQQKKQGDSLKDAQDSFMSSHNTSLTSKQDNTILNNELFEQPKKSIFEENNFIQAILRQQQETTQRLLQNQKEVETSVSSDNLKKVKKLQEFKKSKEQLNSNLLENDQQAKLVSPQQSDQDEYKNNNSMNDLVNEIQQKMSTNTNQFCYNEINPKLDNQQIQKEEIYNLISKENIKFLNENNIKLNTLIHKEFNTNQTQSNNMNSQENNFYESNKIENLNQNQFICQDNQVSDKQKQKQEQFKDTFITQIKYSLQDDDLNDNESNQNYNDEKYEVNNEFQDCDNTDEDEQVSNDKSISNLSNQNKEDKDENESDYVQKEQIDDNQENSQEKENRISHSQEKVLQFFTTISSPKQYVIKKAGQNQTAQISQQFAVNKLKLSSQETIQKNQNIEQQIKNVQEKSNNYNPNNNRYRNNKQTSQSTERSYSAYKNTPTSSSRANQNKQQRYHQLQRSQSSQPHHNKRVPAVEFVKKNSDIILSQKSEFQQNYSETPTLRGIDSQLETGNQKFIDERIEEEKLNSSIMSHATDAEYNNIYELIKPTQKMSPRDIQKVISKNCGEVSKRLLKERQEEEQQINIQGRSRVNSNINQNENIINGSVEIKKRKLKSTIQMLIVTRFTANQNNSEITEVNVIIVNTDRHQIIDEFHQQVKPEDQRKRIDIKVGFQTKKASPFDIVFVKVCNFLKPYLDNYKCCILYESDFDAQIIHNEFVRNKIVPSIKVFEVFYKCILLIDIFPPSFHIKNQPIKNLQQAFTALGLKNEYKRNKKMEEVRQLAKVVTGLLQKGVAFCSNDIRIAYVFDVLEKNVQFFLDLCIDAFESTQYFFILEFQHGKAYEYNQLDRSAIKIQILQKTNGFQLQHITGFYGFHYDFYRSDISAFHFFFQSYLNVLKINPNQITLFVLEEDDILAKKVIELMFPLKKPKKIILHQEIQNYLENNMQSLLQKSNFCFDFQQLFTALCYKNQPVNSLYQM